MAEMGSELETMFGTVEDMLTELDSFVKDTLEKNALKISRVYEERSKSYTLSFVPCLSFIGTTMNYRDYRRV